jgi:hypothetical protein
MAIEISAKLLARAGDVTGMKMLFVERRNGSSINRQAKGLNYSKTDADVGNRTLSAGL